MEADRNADWTAIICRTFLTRVPWLRKRPNPVTSEPGCRGCSTFSSMCTRLVTTEHSRPFSAVYVGHLAFFCPSFAGNNNKSAVCLRDTAIPPPTPQVNGIITNSPFQGSRPYTSANSFAGFIIAHGFLFFKPWPPETPVRHPSL